MRHGNKGRKLQRTASHRAALLRMLATSLLKHKRIKTTLAKAKEVKRYVDQLITTAKKNDLHARRQVMSVLYEKEVTKELFSEIIGKIGDRPGGYTRVIKLGNRLGDAAEMAIVELVDYNDIANKKAEERKNQREVKAEQKKEAVAEEKVSEAKVVEETEK
ncbi:MAG: 50S ribosomal protein L17 [Bacteroidota bacterium]|nr:50S ribosomal protein L17 [Bacteroidota bacterium]